MYRRKKTYSRNHAVEPIAFDRFERYKLLWEVVTTVYDMHKGTDEVVYQESKIVNPTAARRFCERYNLTMPPPLRLDDVS